MKAKLRYATKIIPLWADDEHETLDAIILVYRLKNYIDGGKEEIVTKVEYWDLEGVRYYVYDGSTLLDTSYGQDWKQRECHKRNC